VSLEGVLFFLDVVPDREELAINGGLTLVEIGQVLQSEETASNEETGGVSSGVVGETSSNSEVSKLL
jgi:hypothetical protein